LVFEREGTTIIADYPYVRIPFLELTGNIDPKGSNLTGIGVISLDIVICVEKLDLGKAHIQDSGTALRSDFFDKDVPLPIAIELRRLANEQHSVPRI
jgi:hypothetical protein